MAYVSITELKAVLGIGNIYDDAIVQAVADSAEDVIKPYLLHNRYGITDHQRAGTVASLWTNEANDLYVGQTVVIEGVESGINGNGTVTELFPYGFKITTNQSATHPKIRTIPNGCVTLASAVDYSAVPEVREASMAVAVDIWMQRMGTTGQQGVDFAPQPYKLGRAMLQRVIGLLGPHIDPKGLVG